MKTPKHLPNRSILVKELTVRNVEAYSGDPIDEVEITLFAQLMPGTYTILCVPYKAGDEAPFTLYVRSNFNVRTNQIWPPEWKKKGLDGPEKTMKDKMLEKSSNLAKLAADKAAKAATEAKIKAQEKLSEKTEWVKPVDRAELEMAKTDEGDVPSSPRHKRLDEARKMREIWKDRTDASGNIYFASKETGMSTFDRPAGFMTKKEIHVLERELGMRM